MDQVSRMAAPERAICLSIMLLNQTLNRGETPGYLGALTNSLEKFDEFLLARVTNLDLEGNTSHECFIHQLIRFEVGREESDLFKWHADLFASREHQVILTALQWNDPAIEQFSWRDLLSAEVIDLEAPAIAFQLQRGLANIASRIVSDFQAVHRQLTTYDHRWPPYADPPLVVFLSRDEVVGFGTHPRWRMICLVEKLDDHAVIDDRVGNPDVIATTCGQAPGDRRFAIARRSIEEDTRVAIDGRPEEIEQTGIEGHFVQGCPKV